MKEYIEYFGAAKDGRTEKVCVIVRLKNFDVLSFEPGKYLSIYGRRNGKLRAKITDELMSSHLQAEKGKQGYISVPIELLYDKEYSKLLEDINRHVTWATMTL